MFYPPFFLISSCQSRDVNFCDHKGHSALHLVASSKSIHAGKMANLLLKSGASAGIYVCVYVYRYA